MTSFRLALLNLLRHRMPTVITVLSTAIAIACSGILLRLNLLSESRFSAMGAGGDAIVGAKAGGIEILLGALNAEGKYPGYLPMKLFESLRAEQTVKFEDGAQAKPNFIKSVIPIVVFGHFNENWVVGTDETFMFRPRSEDSPKLHDGSWAADANQVVVGSRVAAKSGLKVGDTLRYTPWLASSSITAEGVLQELKVTGVLEPTHSSWDRELFTNLTTAQAALASPELRPTLNRESIWGNQVLSYFLVYLEPNGFSGLEALINRRTVGQAVLVTEQRERLADLTGTGKNLGIFVTVLILLLSGLSVSAMLITRFEAMSPQLAVLRAIGYKKKQLGAWLLWEGFLLGVGACLIGAVLDAAGFPLMRAALGSALPSSEIVQSSIFFSAPIWITAIAFTILSVLVPLWRVYRQDVHAALRN